MDNSLTPATNKEQNSQPYVRLLRNRNFLALLLGQLISFIGDYFIFLALPIIINRLTQSTMMVGLSFMSNAIPTLLLGPIAGVFVDRWDRQKTMIAANVLRASIVLFGLLVQTREQVWMLYMIGFLMACTSQFFYPSRNAVLPLIIEDQEDLLTANGLMQIIMTVGLLVGPALAGFSIGLWGEKIAFFANAAGFGFSAIAILTMRVPRTTSGTSANNIALVWLELCDGLAYLFKSRILVGVMICLSVVMLGLGAINAVYVPYLQRAFQVGPEGLGIVDSAQGVGMVVGGVILGFLSTRMSKKMMVVWGLAVIGLMFIAQGLSPTFAFIVAFSVPIGIALVPAEAGLTTIMQLAVPDLKRGRVGSSLNAVTTAASLISMAFASLMGEWIGLRTIYIIFGGIVAVSGLIGLWILQDITSHTEQAKIEPSTK